MKADKLYLTIIERPSNGFHGGYKYLITQPYGTPYTAFNTENGFKQFVERANVSMELETVQENTNYGKIEHYVLRGNVEKRSFWHLTDLPENAVKFTGLSNGSLVDCYYTHTETGSIIYRPNPNAKEVYKPLPLQEHIEFQRVNG